MNTGGSREPGTLGRYRLSRILGRGGSGEVWEAELEGPGGFRKPVAIKLLAHTPSEASREALMREARLGALLNHPNVVSTFELAEERGTWFVAMELVRGRSIADAIAAGPLGPQAVVDLGVQCCAGLAHMHGFVSPDTPRGIVHRDIKPGNLLIDETGLVKIADLGISALTGTLTGCAGTPGYMAPETWSDSGTGSPQADLFAVGVTLFAAATGKKAFPGGLAARKAISQVERLLAAGLVAPAEHAVPGLGPVLHRCLRADPAERWESARDLGTALGALRRRNSGGIRLAEIVPAPDAARPATTVRITPGNLPRLSDQFVGREREISNVANRLGREGGLVTLIGLGGAGKTRLALEVLHQMRDALPGGAWFVDLSTAITGEAMCAAVAGALGVQLAGSAVIQLGHAMAARGRLAICLDNLEQLGSIAADVLRQWVELAPEVSFLCTSRIPLRLRREHRVTLDPLGPDEALALFLDRAPVPVARPDAQAVVALLEGHPLAIELAAARTRMLSATQILERLGNRLQVLAGGERDRPSRQRSVRASLDGSWELLSAANQAALAQLTVFEGGFDPAAAEAVMELSEFPDAGWGLDVLTELVDASLVRVEPRTDRFSLQIVVGAYAAEKLSAVARLAAEQRHALYYAQLGSRAAIDALRGPEGGTRRHRLALERANLLVAGRRCAEQALPDPGAFVLRALVEVVSDRGAPEAAHSVARALLGLPFLEGTVRSRIVFSAAYLEEYCGNANQAYRDLLEVLNGNAMEGDPSETARILVRLGSVCSRLGRPNAEHFAAALELARGQGDLSLEVSALLALGIACIRCGDPAAIVHLRQAIHLCQQVGHRGAEGRVWSSLGGGLARLGRRGEAIAAIEAALPLLRSAGHVSEEATASGNLGDCRLQQGDLEVARPLIEHALAHHRAQGGQLKEAYCLANLGTLEACIGRVDRASEYFDAAIALASARSDHNLLAFVRLARARLHVPGKTSSARALLELALADARQIRSSHLEGAVLVGLAEVALEDGSLADCAAALDDAEPRLLASEALDERILLLCCRARLSVRRGNGEAADACLTEAAEFVREVGGGPRSPSRRALESAQIEISAHAHT